MRSACLYVFCLLSCLGTSSLVSIARGEDGATLTIGSKAPELNVEHWVQMGEKFKPVTKFEKGKVYVVEFWATWCGPCRQSMPHLAELQTKYAAKGVQMVSISDEDLDTVKDFLEKTVPGDDSKTYAQLTKPYCLTTDPDGTSNKDYLEAAGQNGIPCAFIVGKDQKIEWIGHPMSMDEPLEAVVAGKWDREAYAQEFKEEQQSQEIMQKFVGAVRRKKLDEGLKMLDEFLATSKNKNVKMQMTMMKLSVVAQVDPTKLADVAKGAFDVIDSEPMAVNQVAWMIYEASAKGKLKDAELLKTAMEKVDAIIEKTDKVAKPSVMDTLAHLQLLNGLKAKAIETQKKAIELASEEEKETLVQHLEEMEKE